MELNSNLDLQKIDQAYASPAWWYDIRGSFILTFAYQTNLIQQIRFFSDNMKQNHLEAAVGTGTMLGLILKWRNMTRKPKVSIVAFDYAEKMLDGAKARFSKNANIKLLREDIGRLNLANNSFDSVNIANSFHCFPNVTSALFEMKRVLKPGGTLAFNVLLFPNKNNILGSVANRINAWGIKKGILNTPYTKENVTEILEQIGFESIELKVHGNSCNYLIRKPKFSYELKGN